jgi:hypothetical protein
MNPPRISLHETSRVGSRFKSDHRFLHNSRNGEIDLWAKPKIPLQRKAYTCLRRYIDCLIGWIREGWRPVEYGAAGRGIWDRDVSRDLIRRSESDM